MEKETFSLTLREVNGIYTNIECVTESEDAWNILFEKYSPSLRRQKHHSFPFRSTNVSIQLLSKRQHSPEIVHPIF